MKGRVPTRPGDATRGPARQLWASPYFFATALAVPLVYSSATIDPVLLPGFLAVSLLGVALATAFGIRIARSTATLSLHRGESIIIGCLAIYMLLASISLMIAGPTPDGIFELLKIGTLAWLIYASSRAVDGRRSTLQMLAKFVILSVFLVGGFAVLQYYQIAIFEWMKRDTTVDSTMAHRNLLASFLVLAFPFVAYAFFECNGRWRAASAVTMLVSVFLLAVLQTRAAWVAFPAGLAFSLIVLAAAMKRAPPAGSRTAYRPRVIQSAALVAIGLSVALLCYSPASRAPMRHQAASLVQLGDASIHERLQLWSRTLRMIRDHPLTGVGLGRWRVILPAYGTEGMRSDNGTLHFQRPHNDFLWAAAETGVLGGVAYLAMFVSVLVLGIRAMVRNPSMHDRVVLTLMLWGVSGYGLDSLFSFPKERVAHPVYLALLTGTLLSFGRNVRDTSATPPFSRRWTAVLGLTVWAAMVLAACFTVSRYHAEVHLRRALEARAAKNWPLMGAELDRIDRRYYDMDPTSVPVAWYRGVARFEMGDRTGALADFRNALAVHPNHVHVLNNVATCQTLSGEHEDAIRTYRTAIAIAPRFEEARTNLGALLHSLGRNQEAYDVLAPGAADATSPRFKECFRAVKAALGRTD